MLEKKCLILVLLMVCAMQSTVAQQPAPPEKTPDLIVEKAYCGEAGLAHDLCELGDTLHVSFTNLQKWMEADSAKNKPAALVLVLDGRVMKGISARGPKTDFKELDFDLKFLDTTETDSKDNVAAWTALLSNAKHKRTLNVSVALAGNPPYAGSAAITLQVFPSYSWLIVGFLIVLLAAFLLLAYRSDILRDGPSAPGMPRLSFSLARCQMAWWFFIVLAAFNYIWMVTGDHDSITAGALILMGISAATGMGSVVLDSSKRDQRQSLQNEQAALTARLPVLAATLAAFPVPANAAELQAEQQQRTARLAEVNTALNKLPSPPGASSGFMRDILQDETGVSFHRFQIAAWTVVLGFVFVVSVYEGLAMPDFSPTLLGLMGISSGTYIGFKIPDPQK
ncbi:MAG TPA: hypothetical protein VNW97_06155 [Candidatus Saccharimonadales bacterium]|jgi:hypothetical protein|nr:hypothetical protein [Candidatus Saccharimonadales bacterium]